MAEVENIIFDLGGVILNIDYNRTAVAFKALGISNFDLIYSRAKQELFFDRFETGIISETEFRNKIRGFLPIPASDEALDHAWNAMLLDIPAGRISFLEELGKKYCLCLLSNTNSIHVKAFTAYMINSFGKDMLEHLFHKVYYSCFIGFRKPGMEVYEHIIKENNFEKAKTLFIDDSPQHVEGALRAGLKAKLLPAGISIENFFPETLH